MIIFLTLIGAVVGWFIFMLLGTNLIGFLVRGFFKPAKIEELKSSEYQTLREEAKKVDRANAFTNIFAGILILVYLYLLFHFFNLGVMAAGLMLMVTRIPDLLWEIRHGKKPTKAERPKGSLYQAMTILSWMALAVLWWSIYWKYS